MFVSEYLGVSSLKDYGVFDALIEKDSHFFINILRLKNSRIPEFIEAYKHLNSYFNDIATLLDAADSPEMSDKMYKSARNKFNFHEVNGINLGFSKSSTGAGWGPKISNKVLRDAYQIIKKGNKQPEIFHLVSLFEENIAGDRLSDMIATIIEDYIKEYTLRIMNDIGINKSTRKELQFSPDGFVINPYKKIPILLLPEEILHELPIARCWDDISRVVIENELIRNEINNEIGEQWKKWSSSDQKYYLFRNIFMQPEVCKRVIDGYKKEKLSSFDLKTDPEYFAELSLKNIKNSIPFIKTTVLPTSYEASLDVLNILKDWIENNHGWSEIKNYPPIKREKFIQHLFHLAAKNYLENNNLDLSCECNSGNGALDFKISRGIDKTIIEVKLSTNSQYLHGYETQVKQYGKAEGTDKMVYVFIDLDNPGRRKKLINEYENNKRNGIKFPELFIIDSKPKKAASTFNFDDFEEINLDLKFDDTDFKL